MMPNDFNSYMWGLLMGVCLGILSVILYNLANKEEEKQDEK